MKELAAILPQYRASILALQGRIAVLTKQLEQATAEKERLTREAATWREAAQRNESSFADVAAKLHTQEAASLASKTSAQQLVSRVEAELHSVKQQYAVAVAELKDARDAAQQAQHAVDSQQKLLNTQANTISRLETTIREQQEDIIAALDLVCHRTAAVGSGGKNSISSKNEFNIDENLDFLDNLGRNVSSGEGTTREALEEEENWTIPASGTTAAGGISGCLATDNDSLETWLHNPSSNIPSKHPSPLKNKKQNNLGEGQATGRKNQLDNSVEMADLANDIAALRDALQRVF
jgi:hypothetical protein